MRRFINHVNISYISQKQMAKVKKLITGEEYIYQTEAIKKSIKLLIAGYIGLLKLVRKTEPKSYLILIEHFNVPVLSSQLGQPSEANIAFTEFFEMLRPDFQLTQQNAMKIIELYDQTKLSTIDWMSLTKDQKNVVAKMFYYKGDDWFGYHIDELQDLSILWQSLDKKAVSSGNFDIRYLIPSYLLSEINGYCYPIFRYLARFIPLDYVYGLSGPHVYNQMIVINEPNVVELRFDTLTTPSQEQVFLKLSELYQCSVKHYFNDNLNHHSGSYSYVNGSIVNLLPKK